MPVVVSNVGGLPEVVDNGITGIIVEPENISDTVKAIEKLILNKELRISMGKEGRKKVKKMYNWDDNVNTMIDNYKEIVK